MRAIRFMGLNGPITKFKSELNNDNEGRLSGVSRARARARIFQSCAHTGLKPRFRGEAENNYDASCNKRPRRVFLSPEPRTGVCSRLAERNAENVARGMRYSWLAFCRSQNDAAGLRFKTRGRDNTHEDARNCDSSKRGHLEFPFSASCQGEISRGAAA